jgi:hypothetical protein
LKRSATVHEKPNERPAARLVLSTAMSAVIAGVFGLIKAWMDL